jgi:TPP-dependent pyruvate/acetoin dehydrogenase alpha subunit
MHLDNGQEAVPALIDTALRKTDKKYSYYRDHSHALASGVDPGKSQLHALHSLHQFNTYISHLCTFVSPTTSVMAELCMKDGGTCRGAGGSMHIYVRSYRVDCDVDTRTFGY